MALICNSRKKCIHAFMHAYIRTYIPTYIHTYIQTYVHTYIHCIHYITLHHIHAHIYVYIQRQKQFIVLQGKVGSVTSHLAHLRACCQGSTGRLCFASSFAQQKTIKNKKCHSFRRNHLDKAEISRNLKPFVRAKRPPPSEMEVFEPWG